MEENQEKSPALFEDRSGELMAQADAAAVARATQEIQAALVIAQRFPRDEVKAESRIMQACRRKGLAEVAEYEYSRGGTRITGPTIDLLRAIANRWGNIQFGWEEVDRRSGQSFVRCFAWDLQSNGKAFRTFVVRHWRDTQAGGYALDDERDIYELLANMAARRVRACLEEVIDADIVDKAIDQCRKTLKEGEKLPIKDRAAKVLLAFAEFGVTQDMIERRLGNKMDAVSENQLASLRRIYKALADGVGKREDYFKGNLEPPKFEEPTEDSKPEHIFPPREPASKPQEPAPKAQEPEPEPQEPQETAQEPEPASKAPEPKLHQPGTADPISRLRLLRELCKVAKVKETELLQALEIEGVTDGSYGSLDDIMKSHPSLIQGIIRDWNSIAVRVKELRPK